MKRGQFSFVWIFAIFAGSAILVLAIYGAMQFGNISRQGSDSKAAKSVAILTDPLQAGFADGSFGKIVFKQETRLNNFCVNDGSFGWNEISVSSKSGIGSEWNPPGVANSVDNKYIFSEDSNQGYVYYVFSKPFEFPYEVSDLTFLMSKRYCFLGDVDHAREEVEGLGIENIIFENCSSTDERICFGHGKDCDSIVYGSCSGKCDSKYDYGVVSKGDEGVELYFIDNLIWGAIFSDSETYECNVERLMFRDNQIADILVNKADLMNARNCGTRLKGNLAAWSGMLKNAGSKDLIPLREYNKKLENQNNQEACGMW